MPLAKICKGTRAMDIGFAGLGNMGKGIAQSLIKAVTGFASGIARLGQSRNCASSALKLYRPRNTPSAATHSSQC